MKLNGMLKYLQYGLILAILCPLPTFAQIDWMSFTADNDSLLNTDNGYTNGLYVSFFETGEKSGKTPTPDFWVKPLLWTLPKQDVEQAINAYMIGHTMMTPSDITIANPSEDELPYSALLALSNSYVTLGETVSDQISVTLGLLGPSAGGEEIQKAVHEFIDADEPQGWDTQLQDEIVFQLTRSRALQYWTSKSKHFDVVLDSELNLGTMATSMSGGAMLRWGRGLQDSYASTLYSNSRMINPVAVNSGKFLYFKVRPGYVFNQIFTDGNTFRDSRSVDYEHEFMEIRLGIAYSWKHHALSFAVTDANILQSSSEEESLQNLTQYGSLTFAWRF